MDMARRHGRGHGPSARVKGYCFFGKGIWGGPGKVPLGDSGLGL